MKTLLTKEQNMQLIGLGVPADLASGGWEEERIDLMNSSFIVPIFTLADLIGIHPSDDCVIIDFSYLPNTSDGRGNRLKNVWRASIDTLDCTKHFYSNELIDCLYELVCYGIENNLIENHKK